ncbi:MAG: sigma-70 family RNA polymerase sigma factor [Firmicutes bacterium]|nr:sigma-70 family RNA polymerase sigma factor [Bacillota bacterium]
MDKEKLIQDNVGLIYKIMQKFYGIDQNDLFQAGALGIIKAYTKYQKNGETKFSTYAFKYIFGEMYKLACNKEIKLSADILKLYKLIEKTRYILAQKIGKIPSNEQLAIYLEMDIQKIDQAVNSACYIMSIDEELDEQKSFHETISLEENVSQDDKILLKDSLEILNDVEKDIIKLRYFADLTQSEIAKMLGLSQVKVSRYEKRSLAKMKEYIFE